VWSVRYLAPRTAASGTTAERWPPPTRAGCTLLLEGKVLGGGRSAPAIWTSIWVALAAWEAKEYVSLHVSSGCPVSSVVSSAGGTGTLQSGTGCICSWRSPWWSTVWESWSCQVKDAGSRASWDMLIPEGRRHTFLKILFPKCRVCRWTHARVLKHWLDLTVENLEEMARWDRVRGSCWGSFLTLAGISGGLLWCFPGAEGPIPLSLVLGPWACNSLRCSKVSFDVPVSGRGIWLVTFFTFPWTCPVKASGSFAVNYNSSRHVAECNKIQQKSLKLPRLTPLLQLLFCLWLLYKTRYD